MTGVVEIHRAVCEHFGLERDALMRRGRTKTIVLARHIAMYLCREKLKLSYPEIGSVFGERDHTSAMQAVKKITKNRDPLLHLHLLSIEERLAPVQVVKQIVGVGDPRRDYFAAAALTGMLMGAASRDAVAVPGPTAGAAFRYADAMLIAGKT